MQSCPSGVLPPQPPSPLCTLSPTAETVGVKGRGKLRTGALPVPERAPGVVSGAEAGLSAALVPRECPRPEGTVSAVGGAQLQSLPKGRRVPPRR